MGTCHDESDQPVELSIQFVQTLRGVGIGRAGGQPKSPGENERQRGPPADA